MCQRAFVCDFVGIAGVHETLNGNLAWYAGHRVEFREQSGSLHIMNGCYADLTVWSLNMHVIEVDSKPTKDDTMALVFFKGKGKHFVF